MNSRLPSLLPTASVLVIGVLLTSGCHKADTDAPAASEIRKNGDVIFVPEGSPLRQRLRFDTALAERMQRKLAAPAVIEADPERFTKVYPPLAGHILKLHVQLGESVNEGQLLATLQSGDYTAAQSDYAKAKSNLALTTKALKRKEELFAAKIVSQSDLEQAQNDFDNAQGDFDAAVGRLQSYGFQTESDHLGDPLKVFAPLSGKVVDISSAHREFHNDPTAPLMTVADLSTVWLTANVPEKDIRFLRVGENVEGELPAYPDQVFNGKVLFIGDLVDPDTRSIKVRVALPNESGQLKPGMFATVNFMDLPDTRVTVPLSAVVQVGSSAFVFVQARPWEFIPRRVVLGQQYGERVVVLEGVVAGDSVVSKEGILLK